MLKKNILYNHFPLYKLLLILSFIMLSHNLIAQSPEYNFTNYTVLDGLSNDHVFCIFKDSRGFIWIGTENGLNRFDGYNFKTYYHIASEGQSLSNSNISSIYEDTYKNLWIGTSEGLNRYIPEFDNFERIKNKNCFHKDYDWIRSIYQDKHGTLWIGTSNLNIYNYEKHEITSFSKNSTSIRKNGIQLIPFITEDNKNNLWIYSDAKNDFLLYDPSKNMFLQTNEYHRNALNDSKAYSFFKDSEGSIWLGKSGGFLVFDPIHKSFCNVHANKKGPALTFSTFSFYGLGEDSNNNMWLGSDNGIYLYNKKEENIIPITNKNELLDKQNIFRIQCMYKDKTGIMWVGSISNGLYVYDPAQVKFTNQIPVINNNQGLNKSVKSVFKDKKGFYWIGTDFGLNRFDSKFHLIKTYTHNPADKSSIGIGGVSAITGDTDGNLWFGTWGGGLHVMDKSGKISHIPYSEDNNVNPKAVANSCIMSLNFDQEGYLWIGLLNGTLDKFDPKSHTLEHIILGWHTFKSVIHDGTLWCPTSDGLFSINLKTRSKVRYSEMNKGLNSHVFSSVILDKNQILWVGYDNGLSWVDLKQNKYEFHSVYEFENTQILSMELDLNGNLWISIGKGIIEFNPATHAENLYSSDEGVRINATCSYADNNGLLFFGGTNGITLFNPGEIKQNDLVPKVCITSFKLFNAEVLPGKKATLKKSIFYNESICLTYNQSVLTFEFVALNFTVPSKNCYAYKMEGFDKDWVYSGSRRQATYTNLNPGTYKFHVKASNNDGVWNEKGATIKIMISPPYWKTTWFKLTLILVLISGTILFFRLRNAAIIAEKEKLEKLVKIRTAEILKQKEEITAQKEQINEMATRAAELVAQNISNEMFDVETLAGLLGMSRTQLYRKFQAIIHQSPADFILTVRINKAKQMLLTNKYTISEISYQVGFKYPGNFTKTFKEQTGYTPTEFINSLPQT